MNASSPWRLVRSAAVAALLVGLLAACTGGADTGGASPSPAASPSARPSPAPTARPTPTQTPIDVAKVFATRVAAIDTIAADVSGSMRSAGVEADIDGSFLVCEDAMRSLMSIVVDGRTVNETETITAHGRSYTRQDGGLWLTPGSAATGDQSPGFAIGAAMTVGSYTVVGRETYQGTRFVRLTSTEEIDLGPANLGLADLSVTDYAVELFFLAREDGTPAGLLLEATWEQATTGGRAAVAFETRYMFTELDKPCEVPVPDDVWTTHASAELGYRMAYPVDWDVMRWPATDDRAASDVYVGPHDGEINVYLYEDTEGSSANAWFRLGEAWIADEFGAEPTVTADLTLADGTKVQVVEVHASDEDGPFFFQEAAVFAGDRAWDVDWYSEPGNEEADRDILRRAVETFVRMDVRTAGVVS